jgi:DNA-binding response OmpR family regulator
LRNLAIGYALATGANDYLTKPVDFAVALARTNTQLDRKRAKEAVLTANESLCLSNENQGTTIL